MALNPQKLSTHSKTDESEAGVIAVLFLFVVAFVFAAISLSMQTGQVVERRIITDQAADSATYAFASKSAQGLNFIAANNLAIASSSHMAGVMHIAADWGILVNMLFRSKSFMSMGTPTFKSSDKDAYQKIYNIVKPIAKIYIRSASGLTRLNSVIKTTFPYLGMVDAISTGGANAPSAVLIPFGTPLPNGSPAPVNGSNFVQKMRTALLNTVRSLIPRYDGLRLIHSDETFCLAYYAAEKAMGKDRHELEHWITGNIFDDPFKPIGTFIGAIIGLFGKIGVIGNFVGIRVGYVGCGFGEAGDIKGGSGDLDKALIANILVAVLTGPMSGRSMKVPGPGGEIAIQSPKSRDDLAKEVDSYRGEYKELCNPTHNMYQWTSWQTFAAGMVVETATDPKSGVCVYEKKPVVQKKYPRNDKNFHQGVAVGANEKPDANNIFLNDYDIACFGTILFKWETYSGLQGKPKANSPDQVDLIAASESNPWIVGDDTTSDICPAMIHKQTGYGVDRTYPLRPSPDDPFPGPTVISSEPPAPEPSYVNLSRGRPFVASIMQGLVVKDMTKAPPGWRGPDPRKGAYAEISEYMACAAGVNGACPYDDHDGKGGYFMNVDKVRYYPKLNQYNWLCPMSAKGDSNVTNMRLTLKFEHPEDDGRWKHAIEKVKTGSGAEMLSQKSKYPDLQYWHNKHVDDFVDSMNCANYEQFASADRALPPRTTTGVNTGSHNYCVGGAHMCWQSALDNELGAGLKNGSFSFMLPGPQTSTGVTRLESSLHYAVLASNPLRVDNASDIIGRADGSALSHCPKNLDVQAKLEDNSLVPVCDIQPVIGYVSRIIQGSNGQSESLRAEENFGGGTANLASGGGISANTLALTSHFLAIAQSSVRYEENATGDPYRPNPNPAPNDPNFPSRSKSFQMFWPSWKPVIEPSRVMSRLLPSFMSPLVED